jgi:hypothetical protein
VKALALWLTVPEDSFQDFSSVPIQGFVYNPASLVGIGYRKK